MFLRKFFNAYLDNSFQVGLSVVSIYWIMTFRFGFEVKKTLLGFLFLGTLAMYRIIKKFHKIDRIKILILIIAFVIGMLVVLVLSQWMVFILMISIFICICYTIPIFPNEKTLRNINPIIKIVSVALCWVLVTVIFPIMFEYYYSEGGETLDFILNKRVVIFSIKILLLVFALMIPFEILDLNQDISNLDTLPQRIGIRNSKYLGILCLLFFCFLGELYWEDFIIGFVSIVCIIVSEPKKNRYFTDVWVEGIPILWLLFVLFGQITV